MRVVPKIGRRSLGRWSLCANGNPDKIYRRKTFYVFEPQMRVVCSYITNEVPFVGGVVN